MWGEEGKAEEDQGTDWNPNNGGPNCSETAWEKCPEGPRWKGICYNCWKEGTSSGIMLRLLSHPRVHVWSAKDHTEGETAPRGVGPRIGLSGQQGLNVPGGPHKLLFLIIHEEPQVLITVGGQSVDFLLDTGATYSVIREVPGILSPRSTTVRGWARC